METGVVAAGAAAVALYVYIKQKQWGGLPEDGMRLSSAPALIEACRDVERPPNTWTEALYYFKEVFRYMYLETFARWHTVDLFVGLAYLSHRASPDYPAADLAQQVAPFRLDQYTPEAVAMLAELREVRRYMLFCRGMRLRKLDQQAKYWKDQLGIETSHLLMQQSTAGLMRPAYVLLLDPELRSLVLCVRGTQTMKDLFTSLTAPMKPHHMVQQDGVLLGFSHLGMLTAARWLFKQVAGPGQQLRKALADNPGYKLRIVGHSMGAGTAVLLTMMLRDVDPAFASAHCYAIACPACLTLELATSCKDYVTTVVNGTDIVPTFSTYSVDALRDEVTQSSWFAEFQRDLRSSVYRAVQGGLGVVGTATSWTTRNVLLQAVVPFRTCYSRRTVGGTGFSQLPGDDVPLDALDDGRPALRHRHSHEGAGWDARVLPPVGHSLPGSPLQESVMQDTLQSCLYAVGTAVHPHHHRSGSNSQLPIPLGGGGTGGLSVDHVRHAVSLLDDALQQSPVSLTMRTEPLTPGAAPGTTATVQQLRRRMWPWGGTAPPAGGGTPGTEAPLGGSAAEALPSVGGARGADEEEEEDERKPETSGRPSASGGSVQWQWRQNVHHRVGQTRVAAARAGEWLWGGVFKACTAPRQYLRINNNTLGGEGGGMLPGGDGGGLRQGAGGPSGLEAMDVDGDRDGDGREHGLAQDEDEADEEEDLAAAEEEELLGDRRGAPHTSVSQQELQAGITAVVAAVSNEASAADRLPDDREAGDSGPTSPLPQPVPPPPASRRAAVSAAAKAALAAGASAVRRAAGGGGAAAPPSDGGAGASVSGPSLSGPSMSGPSRVSVDRPGETPSSSRKRCLYPAGRILHFFPATALVQPSPTDMDESHDDDNDEEGFQAHSGGGVAGGTDGGAGSFVPPEVSAPIPIAYPVCPPSAPSFAMPSGASLLPEPVLPVPSTAPYVVCQMPGNEVYGRIRLCKTMVTDHLIPAYLLALDSIVAQLEVTLEAAQAGHSAQVAAGGGEAEEQESGVEMMDGL